MHVPALSERLVPRLRNGRSHQLWTSRGSGNREPVNQTLSYHFVMDRVSMAVKALMSFPTLNLGLLPVKWLLVAFN